MNKKLLIAAVGGCAVVACVAAANKNKSQHGPKPTMWDKMREGMEEMPEDFPPRMMFDNIETAKANTEEILALLRKESPQHDDIEVMASI
jgi:hypothetical protein